MFRISCCANTLLIDLVNQVSTCANLNEMIVKSYDIYRIALYIMLCKYGLYIAIDVWARFLGRCIRYM